MSASAPPYLCIPLSILAMEAPSLNAKVLLADIIGMYNSTGKVFASDDYYAERYSISKRSIGDAIKWLDDSGWVAREINPTARAKRGLVPTKKALSLFKKSMQNLHEVPAKSASTPSKICNDSMQNLQGVDADFADYKNSLIEQFNKDEANASSVRVADQVLVEWQAWSKENAPAVLKIKTQPTGEQLTKLYQEFGKATVLEIFSEMDNYRPLLTKYTSAHKTARSWCQKRRDNPSPKNSSGGITPGPKSHADKIRTQRQTVSL